MTSRLRKSRRRVKACSKSDHKMEGGLWDISNIGQPSLDDAPENFLPSLLEDVPAR